MNRLTVAPKPANPTTLAAVDVPLGTFLAPQRRTTNKVFTGAARKLPVKSLKLEVRESDKRIALCVTFANTSWREASAALHVAVAEIQSNENAIYWSWSPEVADVEEASENAYGTIEFIATGQAPYDNEGDQRWHNIVTDDHEEFLAEMEGAATVLNDTLGGIFPPEQLAALFAF